MIVRIENRHKQEIIVCGEYNSVKYCVEKNTTNLRGAYLRNADLVGADLRNANLVGANLYDADLRGANLVGADLRSADLRNANLVGADLRNADLVGADLVGADLRGANLVGAEDISESHDIFLELCRRQKVESITKEEWHMIGILSIHRICWGSIKKRFGKKILPLFKKIADAGHDDFLKRYEQILNNSKINQRIE